MAQAKTLTQAEIDQVLRFVSQRRYAARDRTLILTSFWSGMRVGEIANLKMGDVLNADCTIKTEIRLSAEQTKGDQARVVFIPQKLRDEFVKYVNVPESVGDQLLNYISNAYIPDDKVDEAKDRLDAIRAKLGITVGYGMEPGDKGYNPSAFVTKPPEEKEIKDDVKATE